jgi:hypothetical protein
MSRYKLCVRGPVYLLPQSLTVVFWVSFTLYADRPDCQTLLAANNSLKTSVVARLRRTPIVLPLGSGCVLTGHAQENACSPRTTAKKTYILECVGISLA